MTRPSLKTILIAGGVAGLGACGFLGSFFDGPSGPAFSHADHIEKGLECKDCHGEKLAEAAPVLPKMAVCLDCHKDLDEKKPPEKQAAIFVPPGATEATWSRVTALPSDAVFDHAKHVKKDVKCAECHTGIEKSVRVTPALAVSMEACVKCHAAKAQAYRDCASCHRDIRPDRAPPSHQQVWAQQHGAVATGAAGAAEASRCALCHTQRACAECHQERAPRDHTMTWRTQTHGIAAALNRDRCQVCHKTDSCDRCHQEAAPRSHVGSWGGETDNHCYSCHQPVSSESCAVCHRGTPSHQSAPPKPAWHLIGMNCRQCHTPAAPGAQRLPHADNGMDCNACHQ